MEPRHLGCARPSSRGASRASRRRISRSRASCRSRSSTRPTTSKVQETDRFSITGLAGLEPERNVDVTLHKADGSTHRFEAAHTLNEDQVAWFRAGSALNILKLG